MSEKSVLVQVLVMELVVSSQWVALEGGEVPISRGKQAEAGGAPARVCYSRVIVATAHDHVRYLPQNRAQGSRLERMWLHLLSYVLGTSCGLCDPSAIKN